MFLVGFLGWTWDSFDFFTVSMTVTEIAKDFDVSVTSVTWVRQFSFLERLNWPLICCCLLGHNHHSNASISRRLDLWFLFRSIWKEMAVHNHIVNLYSP
jgi:hypothetical protein